jgi:hypothetical protein
MTRQQQNEIIINALGDQLSDQPNVQERIGAAFGAWFQSLVQKGAALFMPPAQPQPEQAQPQAEEQTNGVN